MATERALSKLEQQLGNIPLRREVRIKHCIAEAEDAVDEAIGNALTKFFPEAKSGDEEPFSKGRLQTAVHDVVANWVWFNVPKEPRDMTPFELCERLIELAVEYDTAVNAITSTTLERDEIEAKMRDVKDVIVNRCK